MRPSAPVHDLLLTGLARLAARTDPREILEAACELCVRHAAPDGAARARLGPIEVILRAPEDENGPGWPEPVSMPIHRAGSWGELRVGGPAGADADVVRAVAAHVEVALAHEQRLAEEAARADRDPLTGLLNHGAFHERIAASLRDARATGGAAAVSLVLLDLDGFKHVNDSAGHLAGDRLLRTAAGRLAARCRASDAACRIGGDEFALLLPDTDERAAAAVAERAAREIGALPGLDGCSFGTATWPYDGLDRDGLLRRADERLYAMKGGVPRRPGPLPPLPAGPDAARERLAVASRLAPRLAPLVDPDEMARLVVGELHRAFGYYLAVVQRLDSDDVLRVVSAAGPLTGGDLGFLAEEQRIGEGVNGRVARTGELALIGDTRLDPDYLRRDPRHDPGSELSIPIRVEDTVWGVLNLEQVAVDAFDTDDVLLAEAVAGQLGAALHRMRLIAELESAVTSTLGALCDALEAKDRSTAEHAGDVADLAESVAARLRLAPEERRAIRSAALLHDIGKIGVRGELLTKPGPLTEAERVEVRRHSEVGADIVARIPFLRGVAPIVRAVHERPDGAGYPDGLRGEEIPLAARIVGVCDAYHAMISDRPYRAAKPPEDAIAELHRHEGTQFDPRVVTALLATLATSGA